MPYILTFIVAFSQDTNDEHCRRPLARSETNNETDVGGGGIKSILSRSRGTPGFTVPLLAENEHRLTPPSQIGLVGVFPYSAIDMSTFEALKLAYARSIGDHEPGVLALLAFGSISGSVGATSVYPLNLVRTRLQASGSSGHPQQYKGIWDVTVKTYEREGWKGFYKGLVPTLAKVGWLTY